MLETALAQLEPSSEELGSSQENAMWIEALPARVYTTPQYGEVPVTTEKLERMVANFKSGIRGQEIATDFEHGSDTAKGKQASGWYKDFDIRPSSDDPEQKSLWAQVAFTDDARKEIVEKKWKYWSLEWDDEYFVNDSGETVADVIIGGGLTNRPVAKRTMPINFSEDLWNELDEDTQKQFAVWSTASVNDLPDSCFLYIESGGKKDSDGKTTPRSLRHLPYKNASGSIDLPHLRNAIARIPQMKGISDSLKSSLQAKARRLLGGKNKSMAEDEETKAAYDKLTELGYDVSFGEQKEWEYSWPGTGSPPTPQIGSGEPPGQPDPGTGQYVPRQQGNPAKENPDIGGGWRRDPLPRDPATDPGAPTSGNQTPKPGGTIYTKFTEGGGKLTLEELAKLVGIPTDGVDFDAMADDEAATKQFSEKIEERVKTVFTEHSAFKKDVSASGEEKAFAEQFPHMWQQHQQMIETDRTTKAHQFAESVKSITRTEGDKQVPTANGLSALAMDKLSQVHKKFAEGTVTLADFEDAVSTIVHGGIVSYGENGSSRLSDDHGHVLDTRSMGGLQSARKLFAEKVAEAQKDHADDPKFTYEMAINEAAKKYPDLADAYQMAAPA